MQGTGAYEPIARAVFFLVKNDIESVEGFVGYQIIQESEMEKISSDRSLCIRRIVCVSVPVRQWMMFVNISCGHMDVQEKLDALKAEKKELNKNLKLVEACKTEYTSFSQFDYTDIGDEIKHSLEVPEYPYVGKKQAEHYDEYEPMHESGDKDVVSDLSLEVDMVIDTDKKNEVPVAVEDMAPVNVNSMDMASVAEVHLANDITAVNMEGTAVIQDDNVDEEEAEITSDRVSAGETLSKAQITYEEYKCMTSLEKAQGCGFTWLRSYDAVEGVVKFKLIELEHKLSVNELMEETELLYKGMRELVVRNKVEEVLKAVEKMDYPLLVGLQGKRQSYYNFSWMIILTTCSFTKQYVRHVV